MARKTNLLQGTLDLLILKALGAGPLHGVAIAQRVAQITNGTFQVGPGSLFPALYRMEEAWWLGRSGANRKTTGKRNTTNSPGKGGGNSKRRPRSGAGFRWQLRAPYRRNREELCRSFAVYPERGGT